MASQLIPIRIRDPQIPSSVLEEKLMVRLSRKEWDLYKKISHQALQYASYGSLAEWSSDFRKGFFYRFAKVRGSTVLPFSSQTNGGPLDLPTHENLLATLQRKRDNENELCSICLDREGIDCITPCEHVFCTNCITDWLHTKDLANDRRRLNHIPVRPLVCPYCRTEIPSSKHLVALSSKMKIMLGMISPLANFKCIIFSSFPEVLRLLKSVLIAEYNNDSFVSFKETWDDNIGQEFGASQHKVLLLPLKILSGDIVLPPESEVVFMEPLSPMIRKHIYDRVTAADNRISFLTLVANSTVEELILEAVQTCHFTQGNRLVGQTFSNPNQILWMFQQCVNRSR